MNNSLAQAGGFHGKGSVYVHQLWALFTWLVETANLNKRKDVRFEWWTGLDCLYAVWHHEVSGKKAAIFGLLLSSWKVVSQFRSWRRCIYSVAGLCNLALCVKYEFGPCVTFRRVITGQKWYWNSKVKAFFKFNGWKKNLYLQWYPINFI